MEKVLRHTRGGGERGVREMSPNVTQGEGGGLKTAEKVSCIIWMATYKIRFIFKGRNVLYISCCELDGSLFNTQLNT